VPKYDLAVVGAGLGGLAAAALATRKNKKVVVLEPAASVGGAAAAYASRGFVFSPTPNLLLGFQRGEALHTLAASLGFSQTASAHSPGFQVALPDRRITVYAEQGEALEELRREFPEEIDAIAKLYRDLGKAGESAKKSRLSAYLSLRRTAAGFMHRRRFSRELLLFFDVQSRFFYRRPLTEISLACLIELCVQPPLSVSGGLARLLDHLLEAFLKQGGEIRYHVPVAHVDLGKNSAVALSIPQDNLDAGNVLLNTVQRKEDRQLFIGIPHEVVPVGMLQNVLCVPDSAHPDCFFSLSLSDQNDEDTAPKGMRAVTASFFSGQRGRDESVHAVGELMPFLNDFLAFADEPSPEPRSYAVPQEMTFKPFRIPPCKSSLLSRSSRRNVFLLPDGESAPAQTVAAAQLFIEGLR
jgi:hypothetical protein